jgi:hypothetical protein
VRRHAKWNNKIAKVGDFLTERTGLLGVMEQRKKVMRQYATNRGPKRKMIKIGMA